MFIAFFVFLWYYVRTTDIFFVSLKNNNNNNNKGHGLGTLIASLQVLLSKAISLEILQSLRSLLTNSSQVSLCLPLPLFTLSPSLHYRPALEPHYATAPQEASVEHVQTISTDVGY